MRITPQTTAVLEALTQLEHATNAALLTAVKSQFPELSATTIHRITKRLVQEKRIGQLRSPLDGTFLFDANPVAHYHFGCWPCGKVQDIKLSTGVIAELQTAIGKDILTDSFAIIGINATCPMHKNQA